MQSTSPHGPAWMVSVPWAPSSSLWPIPCGTTDVVSSLQSWRTTKVGRPANEGTLRGAPSQGRSDEAKDGPPGTHELSVWSPSQEYDASAPPKGSIPGRPSSGLAWSCLFISSMPVIRGQPA